MSDFLENPIQIHNPYTSINAPASVTPATHSNAKGEENPPKAEKPKENKCPMPKENKGEHQPMDAPKTSKSKNRVVTTSPKSARPRKGNRNVIYLPNGWSRQVPIFFSDFEDIDTSGIETSLRHVKPSHFSVPCLCHQSCITRTPYKFD